MGNLINIPDVNPQSLVIDKQPKKTSTFDAKNYLNVRLGQGEKSKTLTIRLLPMDLTTGNPFVMVHTHSVKVPKEISENGFKSYICPRKSDIDHEAYGNKCPFCEINHVAYEEYKKALENGNKPEADKWMSTSTQNMSHKTVIVRCIERGKENEGVKFWKFNIREQDLTDPYNQIMDLYNLRKEEGARAGQDVNILSIYNGRDLNIKITEGNAAPSITDAGFSTPLSNDEKEIEKWVMDSKRWQDVFAIKPYDYLYLVSQGLVPWYDRDAKKWVDKNEYNAKHSVEQKEADDAVKNAENAILNQSVSPENQNDFAASITVPESIANTTDNDDDLPF